MGSVGLVLAGPVTLEALYAELAATPSDINEHMARLRATVERHNADNVIELGVRSGVSSVAFLAGLENTGGHLWSVDIDPKPTLGLETDIADRWTFIQGDDLDPDTFVQLPKADIVFIDTNHFYDQTIAELSLYRWKVNRGGCIILHDTQLEHPIGAPPKPAFPVRVAIEEFVAGSGYSWIDHPPWPGLGIIDIR